MPITSAIASVIILVRRPKILRQAVKAPLVQCAVCSWPPKSLDDQRKLAGVAPLFFDVQLHRAARSVVERRVRVRRYLSWILPPADSPS